MGNCVKCGQEACMHSGDKMDCPTTPPDPTAQAGEIVERVARAIWIVQRRDLDKCDMELEDVGNHYETFDMARAAIAALNESPKP